MITSSVILTSWGGINPWETGDIVAYVLGGEIASPFNDRAVLFPNDIEVIDTDAVVIKKEATAFLRDKWEDLQHRASQTGKRIKKVVDQTWHRFTR